MEPQPLKRETNSMKTTLLVVCFLCATAAFGQSVAGSSGLSSEPVIVEFAAHPGRASQKDMGTEQNLLERGSFTHARGERPLWEFATPSQLTPLGDSARNLKKNHESAKKADIVWTN
jgi:hypothetical protein